MWLIPSVIIIFVSANHRTWHIQCADAVISGIFRIDSQNSIDIFFCLTPEPQVEQSAFFVHCVQIVFGHSLRQLRLHQMQAFFFLLLQANLICRFLHPPHAYYVSPSLCERDSIYPLGGVFCRRVRQNSSSRGRVTPKGIYAICIVFKGLHSTAPQSRLSFELPFPPTRHFLCPLRRHLMPTTISSPPFLSTFTFQLSTFNFPFTFQLPSPLSPFNFQLSISLSPFTFQCLTCL